MKVYAFVGPSGTGKSYRAQFVATQRGINYIIDDGLLIKDNAIITRPIMEALGDKSQSIKDKYEIFKRLW